MTTIIAVIVTWFITLIIPHIRAQYQRNKAWKQQELTDLIERTVEQKLKQIIEQ
jgi:hypothetical protein